MTIILEELLKSKPLYYKNIDKNRFFKIFDQLKDRYKFKKIIHIVGTNGKGSTGRFLAQILLLNGFKVGHYTSPHIFDYKERFWINGEHPSEEEMQRAFQELEKILHPELQEQLSYFELLTLLSFFLFAELDYLILEAGVGGEFDATNAFDKILTLFTKFGLDHQDILGKTLKEISKSKLNAMQDFAILNHKNSYSIYNLACEIAKMKGSQIFLSNELLNEAELSEVKNYIKNFSYPKYQEENLLLAYAGAKFLLKEINIKELPQLSLQGRFQKIRENIIVDVGHNELGAYEIKKALKGQKITLVFNTYKDKNFKKILKILKANINEVELYSYKSSHRPLANNEIKEACKLLNIKCKKFSQLKEDKFYLVFGSFVLVEQFLRKELNIHAG